MTRQTRSDTLQANVVGFDFTPSIHPEHGAWGTTPEMISRAVTFSLFDRRTVRTVPIQRPDRPL